MASTAVVVKAAAVCVFALNGGTMKTSGSFWDGFFGKNEPVYEAACSGPMAFNDAMLVYLSEKSEAEAINASSGRGIGHTERALPWVMLDSDPRWNQLVLRGGDKK